MKDGISNNSWHPLLCWYWLTSKHIIEFFLPKYKNNHLFPFLDDTLKIKYLLKKKEKKRSILGKLENLFWEWEKAVFF